MRFCDSSKQHIKVYKNIIKLSTIKNLFILKSILSFFLAIYHHSIYLMFLDKKFKNKYTIGKQLRQLKNIRKHDPSAKPVPMPKPLEQYTNQLFAQGLQVRNLKFAMFKTKNGLPYPGLIATETILANTILVKVPVECLLTTRDAFLSDIQKIFVQNANFYAKEFSSDWEDRILLTYLLYEYQKGKKSKWYLLIENLPKDIDYAIFWDKSEIDRLEDKWMASHIERERDKFQKDSSELIAILKRYPEFFFPDTLSRENVIWLHTHLVTRCFGKYFEYTTMVPFAQLFNHQCTDVYYSMYYKPGNPHDEHEQFYEEKQLTQEDMDECDSSDGSYDAEDFDQDDEYLELEGKTSLEQFYGTESFDLLTDIKNMRIHIFTFINFSDSISHFYLQKMLREVRNLTNLDPNQRKKKCEEIHSTNVKYIKKIKELYHRINRKYYTYGVRQRKTTKKNQPPAVVKENEEYFNKSWKKDKFDEFYMLCSTKDQFEKGSQVYFCYGRLPNKLLLMRYGIALEHNKYDHMFIRINFEDQILGNVDFKHTLQEIRIKKVKRFKLKRTKLCLELIVYHRIQKWNYGEPIENIFSVKDIEMELQVLASTKSMFEKFLSEYKETLAHNQQQLSNPKLGYHEHFALIYKLEQQRILTTQIQMIQYGMDILKELRNGISLRECLLKEEKKERITMQIMMEPYLKTFQVGK